MSDVREPQYFFIIGAMKAGTTSLYKYLAGHPDLYASPRKEPRIFRDPVDPLRQRATFLTLFNGRKAERWCFEASTAYTKYPRFAGVPRRLEAVVPSARFVYLVRDPIARTWSHYVHNLAHGREIRPFAQAIAERPQYIDISRYYLQLQQYYQVFPKERILIQVFEEMVREPAGTVRAVCDFLGVDAAYIPATATVAYNASREKVTAPRALRMMRTLGIEAVMPWRARHWLQQRGAPLPAKNAGLPAEVRAAAVNALRPDTERFFEVLGRRIPAWADFA